MDDIIGVIFAVIIGIASIFSAIAKANKKAPQNKSVINKPVNYNNTKNYNVNRPNNLMPNYNNKTNTAAKPKVEEVYDFRNYKTETPAERRKRLDEKFNTQSTLNQNTFQKKPLKEVYEGNSLEMQESKPNLTSWNDKHPYEANSSQKQERVYVESTSTAKNDEGCEEHYNSRLVMVDKLTNNEVNFTEMQKVIVFGEILNSPRYKEY